MPDKVKKSLLKIKERSNSDTFANDKRILTNRAVAKYVNQNEYPKGTSENLPNLIDNLAHYFLGMENTGTIPSRYKPARSKDPKAKYYTWPELRNDVKEDLTNSKRLNMINDREKLLSEKNNKYLPSYVNEANFDQLYNYFENSHNARSIKGNSANLGTYSVTTGKDERGKYFGIHDNYDWNLLEGLGIKGNSWETYDRIYEDEWNKIPKARKRKMENGGKLNIKEDPIPKGYKPLSQQQRQHWNNFVRYLNKDLKIGGSKDLDEKTNAIGLNYLKQYAKDNPEFSITPEMVPYVQYEFQQLKNTNTLPGVNPTGRVKTLISDYFNNREVSKTDGWIGSLTSRQGYPVITEFSDDPQKKFWNLDYEGASEYEDKMWNKKITPSMKNGGLSRSKDYGSKQKPYPSVSKGDFAGKGRSYPIPTKADAVDALRLAGLHGRSDVKAKVYKKYPELKKGKYGLKTKRMDNGGNIDPTDPEFVMKMQELLRTNPELAQDLFAPVTSTTPPGTDINQQLNLEPTPQQQLAWQTQEIPNFGENINNFNVDSQQRNNNWKNKSVNIPVGDAISGLVMGANALATEYIDNPRKRANEMRLFRKQLAPINSKPSQGGYDMPILAKSGIKITSAYNNLSIPRDNSAPKKPWGNKAEQYKTDNSDIANVLVEGGEFLELPDGQTSMINGDSHSDYSGGELMRLPEGSKVYSDSIKVDPIFAKDLTGSKFKKKKTVAQLAKKYDTEHEEGILKDPTSDNISKRSANIMKTFKQGQLQQLFDYQEAVKDPLYLIEKDTIAQDFIGTEDEVVARKGVKVMQEGGKNGDKKKNPLAPNRQPVYTIQNGVPVQVLPEVEITSKRNPRTGFDPMTGRYISNLQPREQKITSVTLPTSSPNTLIDTPITPNSTPEWTPMDLEPIRGKYILNTLSQGVQPPQLQPLNPPTTIQPGDTPIDPNSPNKPIPDNNKVNPPAPSPKVPWGDTLGAFGEVMPEIFAMIQNQSDFPIFTAKYQPKYLNPVELNIQASLNRNYSQTQPLLQSTGNPSIDNARSAQAIANLYDANNQMFEQKFNFDTQNRYQTDATNLEIENQANLLNLQRADQFWDKVTARQAVKEATNNNIVNSAYSKFKRKQLENRSLQLTNQMFDNFKYDPNRGIYFDNNGQEFVFHEPSGNFINIGTGIGDGIKTTRTTRTDNKGKTVQTIKQEEKRGS